MKEQKILNDLIETIVSNSENNEAKITNVELWAKSWREEMKQDMTDKEMDLETKFKEETGFDAFTDNDLRPQVPTDYYVEWLEYKIEEVLLELKLSELMAKKIIDGLKNK